MSQLWLILGFFMFWNALIVACIEFCAPSDIVEAGTVEARVEMPQAGFSFLSSKRAEISRELGSRVEIRPDSQKSKLSLHAGRQKFKPKKPPVELPEPLFFPEELVFALSRAILDASEHSYSYFFDPGSFVRPPPLEKFTLSFFPFGDSLSCYALPMREQSLAAFWENVAGDFDLSESAICQDSISRSISFSPKIPQSYGLFQPYALQASSSSRLVEIFVLLLPYSYKEVSSYDFRVYDDFEKEDEVAPQPDRASTLSALIERQSRFAFSPESIYLFCEMFQKKGALSSEMRHNLVIAV